MSRRYQPSHAPPGVPTPLPGSPAVEYSELSSRFSSPADVSESASELESCPESEPELEPELAPESEPGPESDSDSNAHFGSGSTSEPEALASATLPPRLLAPSSVDDSPLLRLWSLPYASTLAPPSHSALPSKYHMLSAWWLSSSEDRKILSVIRGNGA